MRSFARHTRRSDTRSDLAECRHVVPSMCSVSPARSVQCSEQCGHSDAAAGRTPNSRQGPPPATAADVRAIWRSPSDDSQCAEATRPAKKTAHVPRRLDPRTMVPTQVLRSAEVWSSAWHGSSARDTSTAEGLGGGEDRAGTKQGQKAKFAVSRNCIRRLVPGV